MNKTSKEYRYQFIRFEQVESGEFETVQDFLGTLGNMRGLGGNTYIGQSSDMRYKKIPIMKEVAIVFDKQTGKLKQEETRKI